MQTAATEDRGDYASGALFLTMVGLGWIVIGLSALGPVPVSILVLPLIAFALLLAGWQALRRAACGLPPPSAHPEADRAIGRATAAEAVAIVVVFAAAGLLHQPKWIMPLVALAVGLHFFPLARALRRPLYAFTGVALCAVAVGVPLFVSPVLVFPALGPQSVSGWLLAVGLSGGIVLWLTVIGLLGLGFKRRQAIGNAPPAHE